MIVDGITLLQMIKDRKIKENTLIEVSGGTRTHYPYVRFSENKRLYWENEDNSIHQAVLTDDLLDFEFEIIKEPEKPKKIDEEHNFYSCSEYNSYNHEIDRVLYILRALNHLEEKVGKTAKIINYLLEQDKK